MSDKTYNTLNIFDGNDPRDSLSIVIVIFSRIFFKVLSFFKFINETYFIKTK